MMVFAPVALAQKMYKCPDGKGGTAFQQMPCAETAEEAEAAKKAKERAAAEAQRQKEEEARKKEESVQKARERDQAYQEQLKAKEEEKKKIEAAESKLMEGTTKAQGAKPIDDGTLPPGFEVSHPGAWKISHPDVTATLLKNKTPGCAQYRYRQRAGELPEYVVQCTTDKVNWVTWFVWPKSDTVRGPAKF
jgi:hypothetical protein